MSSIVSQISLHASRYSAERGLRCRFSDSTRVSLLHEISIFALYNDPRGFFARAEANWYNQENDGFPPDPLHPRNDPRPGDDFWQLNAYAGWRS